jgi:hypothetical protein
VAAARVDVGLVDDHQVGQFHHALLDGLQVVARIGQLQQHEQIGHAGHRGLALSHAHGLDDHHVEAGRLAHAAATRASSRPRRPACRLLGLGRMKARSCAASCSMRVLSPRMEPPDAVDAGVHRQHRHAVAPRHQIQAQRLDEGALAHAGHAADAQAQRLAAVRQHGIEQCVGAQRGGRRGWIPAA